VNKGFILFLSLAFFPAQAWAQTVDVTNVSVLTKSVLAQGDKAVSSAVSVADDQSKVTFKVDRTSFTDKSAEILITVDFSDDGKTWGFLCSATAPGGELKSKGGMVLPLTTVTCPQMKPGSGRQVRTSIDVLTGTANIGAEVETK